MTKVSPAPLGVGGSRMIVQVDANGQQLPRGQRAAGDPFPLVGQCHSREDAEFFALARNAEDVMMRRRLYPYPLADGTWGVDSRPEPLARELVEMSWSHPYIAIVEADKWLKEQEAKRGS